MAEKNRGLEEAKAQYESIRILLDDLDKAQKKDDAAIDAAEEAILEDPLSCEVRKTYEILLCWGGPAARIVGELDEHNEPETAVLQYQDWFTFWTDFDCDKEVLLEYARHFYFAQ